jgi:trehalose utilization protein
MSSEVGLRVTVWGKRLEREKPEAARIYPDGIHETVASALRAELGGTALVRTATLDAPEHGRTSQVLRETDVLAWWSHRAPGGRNETMVRGMGDLRAAVWYRRHDEYDST